MQIVVVSENFINDAGNPSSQVLLVTDIANQQQAQDFATRYKQKAVAVYDADSYDYEIKVRVEIVELNDFDEANRMLAALGN